MWATMCLSQIISKSGCFDPNMVIWKSPKESGRLVPPYCNILKWDMSKCIVLNGTWELETRCGLKRKSIYQIETMFWEVLFEKDQSYGAGAEWDLESGPLSLDLPDFFSLSFLFLFIPPATFSPLCPLAHVLTLCSPAPSAFCSFSPLGPAAFCFPSFYLCAYPTPPTSKFPVSDPWVLLGLPRVASEHM